MHKFCNISDMCALYRLSYEGDLLAHVQACKYTAKKGPDVKRFHPRAGMGIQAEEAEAVLESVGFNAEMRQKPIASLSGGWKMKLALGADFALFYTPYCAVRAVP